MLLTVLATPTLKISNHSSVLRRLSDKCEFRYQNLNTTQYTILVFTNSHFQNVTMVNTSWHLLQDVQILVHLGPTISHRPLRAQIKGNFHEFLPNYPNSQRVHSYPES